MALDILVGNPTYAEILAQIGEESHYIVQERVANDPAFPLLRNYFDNYYGDHIIPIEELHSFKEEIGKFCELHLPIDAYVDRALQEIRLVIDYAIIHSKPIMMYAD